MTYNILVTGGADYIGSVLVPELLKSGHQVTVLDNFMYKPNSLLECCYYENFRVINGDARDEALIKELVRGIDIVIPLAALVGAPLREREKIARAGMERAHGEFNCKRIAQDMLDLIEKGTYDAPWAEIL
jgi:nucleoside-diphosphate-sugar epimerase